MSETYWIPRTAALAAEHRSTRSPVPQTGADIVRELRERAARREAAVAEVAGAVVMPAAEVVPDSALVDVAEAPGAVVSAPDIEVLDAAAAAGDLTAEYRL